MGVASRTKPQHSVTCKRWRREAGHCICPREVKDVTKSWTEDGETVYYHDACAKGTDIEKYGTKVTIAPKSTTCAKCGKKL